MTGRGREAKEEGERRKHKRERGEKTRGREEGESRAYQNVARVDGGRRFELAGVGGVVGWLLLGFGVAFAGLVLFASHGLCGWKLVAGE